MSQFQTPFKTKLYQYGQQIRKLQIQSKKKTIRKQVFQTQRKQIASKKFNEIIDKLDQGNIDQIAINDLQKIIYTQKIVFDSQKCQNILSLINYLIEIINKNAQELEEKLEEKQQILVQNNDCRSKESEKKQAVKESRKNNYKDYLQRIFLVFIRSIQLNQSYCTIHDEQIIVDIVKILKQAKYDKLRQLSLKLMNLLVLNYKNKVHFLNSKVLQILSKQTMKQHKKYIQLFLSNLFNFRSNQCSLSKQDIQDVHKLIQKTELFNSNQQLTYQLFFYFTQDFLKAVNSKMKKSKHFAQCIYSLIQKKHIFLNQHTKIAFYWSKTVILLVRNLQAQQTITDQYHVSTLLYAFRGLWQFHWRMQQNYMFNSKKIYSPFQSEYNLSERQLIQEDSQTVIKFCKPSIKKTNGTFVDIFYQTQLSFSLINQENIQILVEQNQQTHQIVRNFVQFFMFINSKFQSNQQVISIKQSISNLSKNLDRFMLSSQICKILVKLKDGQKFENEQTVQKWVRWFQLTIHDYQSRVICTKNLIKFRRQGKMNNQTYSQIGQIYNRNLKQQEKDLLTVFIIGKLPCPTTDEIEAMQDSIKNQMDQTISQQQSTQHNDDTQEKQID